MFEHCLGYCAFFFVALENTIRHFSWRTPWKTHRNVKGLRVWNLNDRDEGIFKNFGKSSSLFTFYSQNSAQTSCPKCCGRSSTQAYKARRNFLLYQGSPKPGEEPPQNSAAAPREVNLSSLSPIYCRRGSSAKLMDLLSVLSEKCLQLKRRFWSPRLVPTFTISMSVTVWTRSEGLYLAAELHHELPGTHIVRRRSRRSPYCRQRGICKAQECQEQTASPHLPVVIRLGVTALSAREASC